MMRLRTIKGAITAAVTPFNSKDEVDIEGIQRNAEFQVRNGISGIVYLGTTGESPTLENDEKIAVIKAGVNAVNKRVPVIVGTGSYSTKESVRQSKQAEELGADALLIVTPYYNKPSQQGLIKHYEEIVTSVSLPVIIYNIPGRTGVNMEPETIKRLSYLENIIGVKEASGNLPQIEKLIAMVPRMSVLSGDDNLTLQIMKSGGKGVISVVSNLLPKEISDLCENCLKGDYEAAKDMHDKLESLFRAVFIETNPVPIKSAMSYAGLPAGPVRLPLCELLPSNLEKLKSVVIQR
jgi:4-hydroxy-tetrahydrodipicolinate synthase